ncbi:Na+ dependent nucleoside transporter N-terminal domain-containing protein, partial [Escherichia coli]
MKKILFLLFCVTFTVNFVRAQNNSTVVVSAGTEVLSLEEPVVENANPYKGILESRQFVFSIRSILRGLLGLVSILLIAFLFSTNRKGINWRTVGIALALQMLIAVGILSVPAVQMVFEVFGRAFVKVLDWTKAGSGFLFGSLMDQSKFGYIFALQILPTIIFFSALTSLLFYW